MAKKILITGFVGKRPAVIYTTIVPHLKEIAHDSEVELMLAFTSGPKGTEVYCERLKDLLLQKKLSWRTPLLFEKRDYQQAIAEIISISRDYDAVYLALKGGMGAWAEELLINILANHPGPEVFTFISDGILTIITDRNGTIVRRKPLASLGLDNYLKLNDLEVNGGEDCEDSSFADWSFNGEVTSRLNPNNVWLKYLCLFERSGFIYAAFDAKCWLENTLNAYQKDFRQHIQICSALTLEKGRILLSVNNGPKSATLVTRAHESGVQIFNIGQIGKDTVTRIYGKLDNLSRNSNPGNALKVMVKNIPAYLNSGRKREVNYFKTDILCMALSGTDSYVNLVAIASHRPRIIIVIYDKDTKSTAVAAERLHHALAKEPSSLPFRRVEFVAVDHVCIGLGRRLIDLRRKHKGIWSFNLTAGTKEQAFNCIFAAQSNDNFWVMDQAGNKVREITGRKRYIPQVYPHLATIARHLGGKLTDQGYLMGKVSDNAIEAAKRVFSHLEEIKNNANLSAAAKMPKPIIDRRGIMEICATGEKINMIELFPKFKFNEQEKYFQNIWLEVFVGACLFAAGADEVVLNLKWQWKRRSPGSFRDELDVVARFGHYIVPVSCKTSLKNPIAKKKNFWEIDYIASHLFGRFARPFLAVPMYVQAGAEMPFGRDTSKNKDGCRTKLLGANQLAHPDTLGNFILS